MSNVNNLGVPAHMSGELAWALTCATRERLVQGFGIVCQTSKGAWGHIANVVSYTSQAASQAFLNYVGVSVIRHEEIHKLHPDLCSLPLVIKKCKEHNIQLEERIQSIVNQIFDLERKARPNGGQQMLDQLKGLITSQLTIDRLVAQLGYNNASNLLRENQVPESEISKEEISEQQATLYQEVAQIEKDLKVFDAENARLTKIQQAGKNLINRSSIKDAAVRRFIDEQLKYEPEQEGIEVAQEPAQQVEVQPAQHIEEQAAQ
jgi:hypothetical protein